MLFASAFARHFITAAVSLPTQTFFAAEQGSTTGSGYDGSTVVTIPFTKSSMLVSTEPVSSLVKQVPSAAASSFSKHPLDGVAPPSNLSWTAWTHSGSTGPEPTTSA